MYSTSLKWDKTLPVRSLPLKKQFRDCWDWPVQEERHRTHHQALATPFDQLPSNLLSQAVWYQPNIREKKSFVAELHAHTKHAQAEPHT